MSDEKIFVIGDIHGCNEELHLLLNRLPLKNDDTIVFLGDYIDRGPNSKEVINTILKLSEQFKVISLMGNHEQMFLDFFDDKNTPEASAFLYNGGTATLASYSNQIGHYEFPKKHIDFFNSLKMFHETNNFFFVHAGLPEYPLEQIKINQKKYAEDLLWIREDFFNSKFCWNKIIIHGHTPVLNPTICPHRINLDTGCIYKGKLSALELPEKILYSVPKIISDTIQEIQNIEVSGKRRSIRYDVILPIIIEMENQNAHFETINYSDHGMLIYTTNTEGMEIQINQNIDGFIGHNKNKVPFSGIILRHEKKSTGYFLAIEFVDKPKDNYPPIIK